MLVEGSSAATSVTPENLDDEHRQPPPQVLPKDAHPGAPVTESSLLGQTTTTSEPKRLNDETATRLGEATSLEPSPIPIPSDLPRAKGPLRPLVQDVELQYARVSDATVGGTVANQSYVVRIGDLDYNLWDTAGLNEGEHGSVAATDAIERLRILVNKMNTGINLLVYCIRASRFRDIMKVNYDVFVNIICRGKIRVVLVVMGAELEQDMGGWWRRNRGKFRESGLIFYGVVCATGVKGPENIFEQRYEESKRWLSDMIQKCCPKDAWAVGHHLWSMQVRSDIKHYFNRYERRSPVVFDRLPKVSSDKDVPFNITIYQDGVQFKDQDFIPMEREEVAEFFDCLQRKYVSQELRSPFLFWPYSRIAPSNRILQITARLKASEPLIPGDQKFAVASEPELENHPPIMPVNANQPATLSSHYHNAQFTGPALDSVVSRDNDGNKHDENFSGSIQIAQSYMGFMCDDFSSF
ncbi:hypothetical protein NP233_g11206 [Leucocoprinus birnbaumii]|uniref:Uncharacterized protein n=1 Tax=Leucocoprinus birnbaumii TaxID=56174 RepID=A0AAD5VHH9_9AGAR|nr:hypothetical protein NP233_g11206 [Leucocoprinus birnbaumii]